MVHFIDGGKQSANTELLSMIESMPEDRRAMVIDAGEHGGTPYLVTRPIEEFATLRQWLADLRES